MLIGLVNVALYFRKRYYHVVDVPAAALQPERPAPGLQGGT